MIWSKAPVDAGEVRELARRYGLDLLSAAILVRRALTAPAQVRSVLESDPRFLHNPFLMPAMVEAVERIGAAIDSGERILVFGDSDVDGVTATVLLVEALTELEADVIWALPEGTDTYGLSSRAVEAAAAAGVGLVVTVDCGIGNAAEIMLAAERGIDVIVTDHHNPPRELPPALAVLDPKLPGYPFRDLCGCAVAAKLEWALRFSRGPFAGVSFVLLNARPGNGTIVLEAVRLANLVETGRIMEDIVPGMVSWERTRLAGFVDGDEILVLDGPLQARLLAAAFGDGAPELSDLAPLVQELLPDLAGRSLIRIREDARELRYAEQPASEIDTLAELFRALVLRRERERLQPALRRMDLVALGTLADLMPLVDENRILVRQGLEVLQRGERSGLRQLLMRRELLGKRISATDVSWQVTPVLNSAGRMGEPATATRLFLAEPLAKIEALVEELFALDERRRSEGEAAWQAVRGAARESLERTGGRCVLVASDRVPRGITGIVASRLQTFYRVPAIVISLSGEMAVGSIRSAAAGFIADLFSRHARWFASCGGHDRAGGFSIARDTVEAFVEEFHARIGEVEPALRGEGTLSIDAEVPLSYLTPELVKVVDLFEPYGEGNPALTFVSRGLRIVQCELMGRREPNHLRMLFDAGAIRWPAVFWNAAGRFPAEFTIGDSVEVAYRLERNSWGASENLRLSVLDVKR